MKKVFDLGRTEALNYMKITSRALADRGKINKASIPKECEYKSVSNRNEVLIECFNVVKDYFNVDKWQINQPIILGELYNVINQLVNVQHCPKIMIVNKYGSENGYSDVIYNINSATKNGIIYPSLDPSIFEVKFPNKDIIGRITTY